MTPAQIVSKYEQMQEKYMDYVSESRACGYEVESFEDWAGVTCPRERAMSRYERMLEDDTTDLY